MPTGEYPDRFTMSFGDHLDELRKRVLWSLAIPIPMTFVVFALKKPLIEWLSKPLLKVLADNDLPQRMQVLGPAEALMTAIKLSLIGAVVISAPWILLQAWKFIKPGLYQHERRFVHFLIPGSAILTAAGIALMYYVMLPLMLMVLVKFGTSLLPGIGEQTQDHRVASVMESLDSVPIRFDEPSDPKAGEAWLIWPELDLFVAVEVMAEPVDEQGSALIVTGAIEVLSVSSRPMIAQEFRLSTYLDFVMLLIMAISIAFQMPLVILLVGWTGIVSKETLRRKRKYALFICGAISAVITPADALSMLMMLVPLYLLYELGIVLLVIAPAKAVAEGTVLRLKSHNAEQQAQQDAEPSQTQRTDDMIDPDGESLHQQDDDQSGDSL